MSSNQNNIQINSVRNNHVLNLRIYCSGTGYDDNNAGENEIVAELNAGDHDKATCLHLAGPGKLNYANNNSNHTFWSTKKSAVTKKLKQGRGYADGQKDMEKNASKAIDWIKEQVEDSGCSDINIRMIGWSRGAITAFMIANEVVNYKNEQNNHGRELEFDLKIFGIDPVSGPSNHQANMTTIPSIVSDCIVVVAANEGRAIMVPDTLTVENENKTNFFGEILPGHHATLVKPKSPEKLAKKKGAKREKYEKYEACYEVVKKIALYLFPDNKLNNKNISNKNINLADSIHIATINNDLKRNDFSSKFRKAFATTYKDSPLYKVLVSMHLEKKGYTYLSFMVKDGFKNTLIDANSKDEILNEFREYSSSDEDIEEWLHLASNGEFETADAFIEAVSNYDLNTDESEDEDENDNSYGLSFK